MSLLHVSVAYLFPCRMSALRNNPVACRYIFFKAMSHVKKLNFTGQTTKLCHPVDLQGQVPYLRTGLGSLGTLDDLCTDV